MEEKHFPSVRYHASGATKLIHTEEEATALEADKNWSDTPATFPGVAHADPKHSAALQPTQTGELAANARVKAIKPRKKED